MWYEFIRDDGLDIVSARGYIRRPFATITNFIIIIIITLRADFANRAHASVTMVERGIASTRFAHGIPDDDVRSSVGGGARTVRLEAPGRCAHRVRVGRRRPMADRDTRRVELWECRAFRSVRGRIRRDRVDRTMPAARGRAIYPRVHLRHGRPAVGVERWQMMLMLSSFQKRD